MDGRDGLDGQEGNYHPLTPVPPVLPVPPFPPATMRFLHLYLAAYFALVAGAAIALWRAGVLARISPLWMAIAAVIVVALGLMAALTSMSSSRT